MREHAVRDALPPVLLDRDAAPRAHLLAQLLVDDEPFERIREFAASFFGLTSNPSTPFDSTRLNPSMRDAAIGLPADIASSSTMPKLSRPVFGAQ